MKKKVLLVGAGVLVVAVLMWKVEWISTRIYQELGRRKIYPQNSMETRYPGEGENKQWRADRLWVEPKGVGKPKYVEMAKRGEYPPTDFDIVEVPAREEWFFTVGKVAGWERIAGSADLYLNITYRGAKDACPALPALFRRSFPPVRFWNACASIWICLSAESGCRLFRAPSGRSEFPPFRFWK